ncbi:tetraacyldisaccharide 4'-kinase [Marinomonas atlantica]|uniref:tetraacyldisaccharide 4'-kinase n=1 Tax=Marinomonas atlantica TaxID=1806668 RepID=UPI000834F448|nr:tetraacyldisaccharide 4'-kinase [Marinomonas atlantica]
MSLEQSLTRSWYGSYGWTWALTPLLLLTVPVIQCKRKKYLAQRLSISYQSKLPVIIVGNITVGGTGKSPMVIALADWLKQQGYSPGIVTRGHKRSSDEVMLVGHSSSAADVGDEPLMLFRRSDCPVAVSTKRVQAIQALERLEHVDVIISDDGLQHYAMDRNIEIVMVDAKRGLGNNMLLPVGPLREPASRLNHADYIFSIGDEPKLDITQHYFHGKLALNRLVHIKDKARTRPLTDLGCKSWTVVAGIGNPARFLETLEGYGLPHNSTNHFFSDHHHFMRSDLLPFESVIMTEKDAVKVEGFANSEDDWWFVAAELELPLEFTRQLDEQIKQVIKQKK